VTGGFGSGVLELVEERAWPIRVPRRAGPDPGHPGERFVDHGSVADLRRVLRLDAPGLQPRSASRSRRCVPRRALGGRGRLTARGLAPAAYADVEEVEVVVAHSERATLRVGDVFLKIDADQARTDVEVEAMALAPIPTRRSCGGSRPCSRSPPSQGRHSAASASHPRVAGGVGRGGCRRTDAARRAAAAMARSSRRESARTSTSNASGSSTRRPSRRPGHAQPPVAELRCRPWTPVFTHGDLQITHVFVDGTRSPACSTGPRRARRCALRPRQPDARTRGAPWRRRRRLRQHRRPRRDSRILVDAEPSRIRWLVEHGFDPFLPAARSTC
jgi:hypothetical protein